MKIVLDENVPKPLRRDLTGHEVYTLREQKWDGLENGDLLNAMVQAGFFVLITCDKNLRHQQNLEKYGVTVLVLDAKSNSYASLVSFVPAILSTLKQNLKPGAIVLQP